MSDIIKIDNLIENMQELVVEEPVVKEKRRYSQSFMECQRKISKNIKQK